MLFAIVIWKYTVGLNYSTIASIMGLSTYFLLIHFKQKSMKLYTACVVFDLLFGCFGESEI